MLYQKKYLKYKNKYLDLKQKIGGNGGNGGKEVVKEAKEAKEVKEVKDREDRDKDREKEIELYNIEKYIINRAGEVRDELKKENPNIQKIMDLIHSCLGELSYFKTEESKIRRDVFTKYFSWFIPSIDALKKLTSFIGDKKGLEVGSGLGLIAALLNKSGCEIIPTDNFNGQYYKDDKDNRNKQFMPITNLDNQKAIYAYPAYTLLLCWPRWITWHMNLQNYLVVIK
jgi:hypothetical protein